MLRYPRESTYSKRCKEVFEELKELKPALRDVFMNSFDLEGMARMSPAEIKVFTTGLKLLGETEELIELSIDEYEAQLAWQDAIEQKIDRLLAKSEKK